MNLQVRNAQRKVPVRTAELERLARSLLELLARPVAEIGVVLVSDRRMRELNRRYRDVDRPTDVLSFDLREQEDSGVARAMEGEVILSAETILRRSRGDAGRFQRETELLLAHGLLHLAGFDHGSPERSGRMKRVQRSLLARLRRQSGDPARGLLREGG